MRFNKKMYKEAFGKINVPKQEETEKVIDQKYKDDILHGRVLDDLAGWDGSNVYYDKEMLKKENARKIIARLPLVILGIVLFMVMAVFTYRYLDLKMNGTCVKAEYVKESKYLLYRNEDGVTKHDGYIFCWKEAEAKYDMRIGMESIISKNYKSIPGAVELYCGYDNRVEAVEDYYKTGSTYYQRMLERGIEPNEAYIMVNMNLSSIYEAKKERYVNLYYMEKEGETYLNLRLVIRWWIVFLMDAVIIAWNVYWIRRLVILVKEQRKLG